MKRIFYNAQYGNAQYGGFSLSEKCIKLMLKLGAPEEMVRWDGREVPRDSEILKQAVEKLGVEKCEGAFCCLNYIDIPDDGEWHINKYDGNERVMVGPNPISWADKLKGTP